MHKLQLYLKVQHRFFLANISKFLRTAFLYDASAGCFYWSCLHNQKHNVVWFLLQRFVNLLRVPYLQNISRNHFNALILAVYTGFCPPLNVYFNDVEIKIVFIYQVAYREFPFDCNLFWKRIDPKNILFIGTINWIVSAVR